MQSDVLRGWLYQRTKVSSSDQLEEGETVELTTGISGKIVRDTFRNTSKIVFRVADIQYAMSLSADNL